MADDFKDLRSIYRMMAPADMTGLPTNVLGNASKRGFSFVEGVIAALFDRQGGGALSVETMQRVLAERLRGASDEEALEFHKYVRIYSTAQMPVFTDAGQGIPPTWLKKYVDNKGTKTLKNISNFLQIVSCEESGLDDREMMIVCSNSHYVNPAVRSAEDAQLFLNYVPTHIMSRCTPYLDVEMVYDRPVPQGDTHLASPGLMKFLLGSTDTSAFAAGTANDLMIKGNTVIADPSTNPDDPHAFSRQHSVAGMEMFTSPQTLVNTQPLPLGSRYVPVLDPFRPLMSIQNLSINVTSTVGLYSYKKATLTLKLHDRSRLAEIADLIQPLVYTKTTLWLTYGWRHPDEPGNPYADFINSTMLVRESYGISNSSYEFDDHGEVTVSLELYTRGVRELRDIRITGVHGTFKALERKMRAVGEKIKALRTRLHLDQPTGLNKEIRAFQLLDAAEEAHFPDINMHDLSKAIKQLDRSFLNKNAKIDSTAANDLKQLVNDYYKTTGGRHKKFVYNEELKSVTNNVVAKIFENIFTGPDVFATNADKETLRQNELQHVIPNSLASVYDTYNQTKTVKGNQKPTLVSFGKIFSSLMAKSVAAFDGVDELQIFFYTFNDRAGLASNQNIAEFPINTTILRDAMRRHVASRRTMSIPVEEITQLVIESQLQDPRGPGYGLYAFYEPYDPKHPSPTQKKGSEKKYDSLLTSINAGRGVFKMPMIQVHVESTYRTVGNQIHDLLSYFQSEGQTAQGKPATGRYSRVIRIHVFDKQVDPYPLATTMLRTDDGGSSVLVNQQALDKIQKDYKADAMSVSLDNLPPDLKKDLQLVKGSEMLVLNNAQGNDRLKRFVSALIPTITYGGNASTVSNISITTKQDANLSAVQMLGNKAGRPSVTQPNGAGTGALPLRVIPASVSITSMGCPIVQYAQRFFIDVQTGTTVDNVYGISGLTHTIAPGKFETQMNMTWVDAYGQYESAVSLTEMLKKIDTNGLT